MSEQQISYIDRQIAALTQEDKYMILRERIDRTYQDQLTVVEHESRTLDRLHVMIESDRTEMKRRLTRIVQAANEILTCLADAELLENAK